VTVVANNPKLPPLKSLHFQPEKLSEMIEPLTMRIERVKGNAKQSMPLPIRDGYGVAGQGWMKDDIATVEQWTLNNWGGGTYQFTVTDANQPVAVMTWSQVFPVAQYPEKIPMPVADPMAAPQMPATPWSPPQMPVQVPTPTWGSYPAPGYSPSPYGAPTMPPPYYPGYPPHPGYAQMPGYPPQPSYAPPWSTPLGHAQQPGQPDYRAEAERARLATIEASTKAQVDRLLDENRRLAETVQRANEHPREDPNMKAQLEAAREARHQAELVAERNAFEARLAAFTAKPTGPSEEMLRMQKMEDDNRREREERARKEERDRQDAQLKEMREEARRDREALVATINELKSRPTGPDPILVMIQQQAEASKEAARIQADASKEIARLAADSARERGREQDTLLANLKHYMMSPGDTARLINDQQQGQHMFVNNMAKTFNDVAGVMRDWYGNMMQQMQSPPESPVIRVVEGGIASFKDMFDRWTTGKTQTQIQQMRTQSDVARAQADAMRPIMPQQVVQQPANGNGQPQVWQPPPPVVPVSLAGAPSAASVPEAPPVPAGGPLRIGGKSDAEWFGAGLNDILQMREHAAFFVESIAMDPIRPHPQNPNRPAGLGPDEAAKYVLTAVKFLESQTPPVPVLAFDYLFKQQMYPQLVEALLPDIHPSYRMEMLTYLRGLLDGKSMDQIGTEIEAAAAATMPAVQHEDDDDGTDGDDDADQDGRPAPPVIEVVATQKPTPTPAPRRRG